MRRKNTLLLFLCLFSLWAVAQEKKPVKIACVGNSITYGSGIKNQFQNSYPGLLSQLLGEGYDVRNFGVSGRVLLNKGDRPYMHEQKFRDLLKFEPDIVTIKLGTNDSKPWNWRYGKDFKKDLTEMLDILQELPSKPKVYLCLPVPAAKSNFGINDSVITNGIIPVIRSVAKKRHLPVVDLYTVNPQPLLNAVQTDALPRRQAHCLQGFLVTAAERRRIGDNHCISSPRPPGGFLRPHSARAPRPSRRFLGPFPCIIPGHSLPDVRARQLPARNQTVRFCKRPDFLPVRFFPSVSHKRKFHRPALSVNHRLNCISAAII